MSDGDCALWSLYDGCSISIADDGQFILSITGTFGRNPQYMVKMIDNDTIELYLGGEVVFKFSRTGGGMVMKRKVIFALVLAVGLVLAGCGAVEDSGTGQREGQAGEDVPIQEERDGKASESTQNYILALGMDYVAESIQTLSEYIGESQSIQAMCYGEIVNAVLMPFQAEDVISALFPDGIEDDMLSQRFAKYITPTYFNSLISTHFYPAVDSDEEYQAYWTEYQMLNAGYRRFMAAKPTNACQDKVLFIFYGNKISPEAVICVSFHSSGNDIITGQVMCFGAFVAQRMVDEWSGWLLQGIWFTNEELLEAQRNTDIEQRSVAVSEESDINEFLIETAKTINDSFCQLFVLSKEEASAYTEEYDVDEDYKEEVSWMVQFADSLERFDMAAVMTVEGSFPFSAFYSGYSFFLYDSSGYPAQLTSLLNGYENLLLGNVDTSYPIPRDWSEDVYVLLGSADADFYAILSFHKVSGQALGMSYHIFPLLEDESFMDIQGVVGNWKKIDDSLGLNLLSDAVFSYASPYGTWHSYEGIQNVYYIVPAFP